MPRRKTTAAADSAAAPVAQREPLAQVLAWVLEGASARDLKEAIAANFPEEDGEALIISVLRDLEKSAARSPDVMIGFCLEASRELYRRMTEAGDYPGALRAIKQLAELTRKAQKRGQAKKQTGDDEEPSILKMITTPPA